MAKFSKASKDKLNTAHKDLQIVFNEVIKYFDCTILCGLRTPKEQFELFKKGREFINGEWIKTGSVVTYVDGTDKKSKHNENPSHAIDAVPYPIEWDNLNRMRLFAGYVLGISKILKEQGKIENDIVWGADWDSDTFMKDHTFSDFPHFQIV